MANQKHCPNLPGEWDQFLTMFNEGTEDGLKRRFRHLLDGELAPSNMPQQEQNYCEGVIKNWQSFCARPGSRDKWTEQTWIEENHVSTFDRVFRSTPMYVSRYVNSSRTYLLYADDGAAVNQPLNLAL